MRGRLRIHMYRTYKLWKKISSSKKYHISQLLFDNSKIDHREQWIIHDERWERIIHRFEDRKRLMKNLPVERNDSPQELTDEVVFLEDGTIEFDGKTETENKWFYLYLDPERFQWENYRITFQFKRDTDFRELQFGFRYQDFYNRYRYRFERNRIFFDKVIKGRFCNGLSVTSFPMQLGRFYRIALEVFDNCFKCFVDDTLMSTDYDFSRDFPQGSMALILWENDSRTDIAGTLNSLRVHKLERT
jgi:hypothetical protein